MTPTSPAAAEQLEMSTKRNFKTFTSPSLSMDLSNYTTGHVGRIINKPGVKKLLHSPTTNDNIN